MQFLTWCVILLCVIFNHSHFASQATLWDCMFGGTTMVLHVDGTTVPGTPAEPQYLCASTYLPPEFVNSHQGSHVAIARIAQLFLKGIGVPTVQQWVANAQARGWLLTQPTTCATPNESSPDLIPTLPAGSALQVLRAACG
jgi:hypothetical protein